MLIFGVSNFNSETCHRMATFNARGESLQQQRNLRIADPIALADAWAAQHRLDFVVKCLCSDQLKGAP